MSTATGTFKLNPMKRSPLSFQTQPATTSSNGSTPVGHEVDTVWRRNDDKKPAEPPAHAKTVKFDDQPKIVRTTSSINAAVSDAEEEEEPTEEELLRRGIHLTRRLSSEVQHREFNWDEDDDDDLALPTSWSMNMLPLSANRSPASSNTPTVNSAPTTNQLSPTRSETNDAAAPEPKEPKKINSPPWKITQPASVTPIDKQFKELSEQRALQERQQQQQQRKHNHNLFTNHNQDHHDYNGFISRPNNEFWRPHEALVDRYRYTDAEKRYRPDIPQPKPDLFNETSGQVETMTRRGRLGGFGRFSESPRTSDENKKHEPVPNTKSRLEEQEETMRLTRENARKRKEEEQKREKEQQEAAKRKADELVARIAAKKAEEKLQHQPQEEEKQEQQEKEKNKQILQELQQPQQQLKQNEVKKPVESKFLSGKPVILKPKRRRGSSITSEDNPSFRAVSSVLGDHDSNIWTGKSTTNNSMLWNPSSVTRSASDGSLWGPISGIYNNESKSSSAYKKDIENSVITSPSTQSSRGFQWNAVNGTSNDNDNDRNDSASGIINKESSAISASNNPTSSTVTTTNRTTSNNSSNSPVNTNVKIDSPNLSRGFSRFFPSSQTGEPREKVELSLPEPKSNNRMIIQSHTVDDYLNNLLQKDAQSGPRVHLPGLAAIEADGVVRSLFKSPPLRSIQALQSTIAEKLGETVVPPAAVPAVPELPAVAAPVISSKIPPLVSTSPAVIKYDKVFVPQAANNKGVEAATKTQLDVRSAVSELEDTLTKSVETRKPIVKVNLLGNAIDVNNPSSTAWDKGRVEAELTFGTSTYYIDPGNTKVYLREFKPRKDIFVALLVPGSSKKVTTTYKIGKGNVKR
ncbi:hypothetical protein D0Z00_004416 [Geotrichum galactomycetum]|uniref:Uncharacterized protein n=1 Tax=Geotrichum galactomycetum TaxID=27317 RepID=A0ACB6UYI1_9ASCO|nr:hypothetical protein D0Z00_004416 [Geotrichum candidum]